MPSSPTTPEPGLREAWIALNALPSPGPAVAGRLLKAFGNDPRKVLAASEKALKAATTRVHPSAVKNLRNWREVIDVEAELRRMEEHGVRFLARDEDGYPKPLREIADPPVGLYVKGPYDFDQPAVALVGTRRATLYGRSTARRLATELARIGFCVVSGLARGIDSEAHEGALSVEGGRTVAVLGGGLDVLYPPENGELYNRIAESGAVVSEYGFGRPVDRDTFPVRNRIISGLSLATVVIESDVRGGSMITARMAGEQGRGIFAVPGRIDQASARGCHQLLRDGATLLSGVDDLLQELGYLRQLGLALDDTDPTPADLPESLSTDERTIAELFADGSQLRPDDVAEHTGLDPAAVAPLLMKLEIKRVLAKRADGAYERRA